MPEPITLHPDDRAYALKRLELGAYYYGFEATGNEAIDLLLGAFCAAGKSMHNTSEWNDNELGAFNSGDSSIRDMIQAAAWAAKEMLDA